MKRIALGIVLVAGALDAQAPSASGVFVSTLGSDTVAIERYTRTGSRLEGDVLTRFPFVQVVHYVADLSDGRFRGMSVASRPAGSDATAAPALSILTLIVDSVATIEVQRAGNVALRPSRPAIFSSSRGGGNIFAYAVYGIPHGTYASLTSDR